ncbi:MAG: metallophosphoesterase [SAR324 cluster bacterium]|nr:metallophosphoesterase [SAR324 cluster bacterium]
MILYAISDIHLDYAENRDAFESLSEYPDDWLILAGDIANTESHLRFALDIACRRFAGVIWVPGNHDLWIRSDSGMSGSVEKYESMVELCREFGVLTPEDPYVSWGEGEAKHILAPLFLLYDYSFRPDDVSEEEAIAWAMEEGILCRDEALLKPAPYSSKQAWCRARIEYSKKRLSEVSGPSPIVLINHFPLRQDLIRLRKIPRFSIWCGTKETESWHTEFPVSVVVTGHLHMRATDYRDGIRFEEVSLGYPRQRNQEIEFKDFLREILPGPKEKFYLNEGPFWRWEG